jgi:hypothetical protein
VLATISGKKLQANNIKGAGGEQKGIFPAYMKTILIKRLYLSNQEEGT